MKLSVCENQFLISHYQYVAWIDILMKRKFKIALVNYCTNTNKTNNFLSHKQKQKQKQTNKQTNKIKQTKQTNKQTNKQTKNKNITKLIKKIHKQNVPPRVCIHLLILSINRTYLPRMHLAVLSICRTYYNTLTPSP